MRSPDSCSVFWRAVFQTLLSFPDVAWTFFVFLAIPVFLSDIILLTLPALPPSFPNFCASTFFHFVLPKTAVQFPYHPLCCSSQHWGLHPQGILAVGKWPFGASGKVSLLAFFDLWWSEEAIPRRGLHVPGRVTPADPVILRGWYHRPLSACIHCRGHEMLSQKLIQSLM